MASTAAKRYAQAVFELAQEADAIAAWDDDLARMSAVATDPTARDYLANPSVPRQSRLELLQAVLPPERAEARNLAALLVERGRVGDLPAILELYRESVRDLRGVVVADVTTAEPLGKRERELVRAQLSAKVGREVELRERVDPEIIGGIVAQVGDQLIDGSVISQLRRLRTRLAAPA